MVVYSVSSFVFPLLLVSMCHHKHCPLCIFSMWCLLSVLTLAYSLSLSISFTPAPTAVPFLNFCVGMRWPSYFFIPHFCHPSTHCLTPPSFQSYKYGYIKVKTFSISLPYRRWKCHLCCTWAIENLGKELCEQCSHNGGHQRVCVSCMFAFSWTFPFSHFVELMQGFPN